MKYSVILTTALEVTKNYAGVRRAEFKVLLSQCVQYSLAHHSTASFPKSTLTSVSLSNLLHTKDLCKCKPGFLTQFLPSHRIVEMHEANQLVK